MSNGKLGAINIHLSTTVIKSSQKFGVMFVLIAAIKSETDKLWGNWKGL